MAQIVDIRHVAMSAQIVIEALRALPPYPHYPVCFTAVADDVAMLDTSSRVVKDQQVVSVLVADAIVAPGTVVPLHYDRLVGRLVGVVGVGGRRAGWFADLHYGAGVALAAILVVPFPVGPSDHSKAYF